MLLRGAHSHLFDIYEIVILDQGVYYSVLKGKHKINQAKGHTTFQKVFSQLNLSLSLSLLYNSMFESKVTKYLDVFSVSCMLRLQSKCNWLLLLREQNAF